MRIWLFNGRYRKNLDSGRAKRKYAADRAIMPEARLRIMHREPVRLAQFA
jgi:hypothetical protein